MSFSEEHKIKRTLNLCWTYLNNFDYEWKRLGSKKRTQVEYICLSHIAKCLILLSVSFRTWPSNLSLPALITAVADFLSYTVCFCFYFTSLAFNLSVLSKNTQYSCYKIYCVSGCSCESLVTQWRTSLWTYWHPWSLSWVSWPK